MFSIAIPSEFHVATQVIYQSDIPEEKWENSLSTSFLSHSQKFWTSLTAPYTLMGWVKLVFYVMPTSRKY